MSEPWLCRPLMQKRQPCAASPQACPCWHPNNNMFGRVSTRLPPLLGVQVDVDHDQPQAVQSQDAHVRQLGQPVGRADRHRQPPLRQVRLLLLDLEVLGEQLPDLARLQSAAMTVGAAACRMSAALQRQPSSYLRIIDQKQTNTQINS